MATVLLSGDFSEAVTTTDTEVAETRAIMLRLLSTIVLANGDVHSPARWIITLTAGAFSRYLVVPDDATAARYSLVLPDGTEQVFTLASGDGPTITVAEVLLLNLVDIEPDALAALLALYTPLATYTAGLATKENSLGNPGTNGYILSSTALGVRSWIEAATSDPIVASVYIGVGAAPAFENGFSNFGSSAPLSYQADRGTVVVGGLITSAAATPGQAIFTMPLALRPTKVFYGQMLDMGSYFYPFPVTIGTDGAVRYAGFSSGGFASGAALTLVYTTV